ncbi:hypothetical protein ASD8599_01334 [Ascidiaceihabitans donghaensis]|uniref:Uncharacterized protein n=1 Tax=Ascidiaceihabitans donghaensis TaxID=1510460 RepID=A0A2R8BCE2_9RHOB|nr:hypothetical protein [Ascidiaceihabitans donghaensis]SPH20597.1 hypothetical protein ASD8599_01334 [Ascidiaceihabitans donghaensis]
MIELLRLLSLYYACDNTAAQRMLTADEIASCTGHYAAIKSHFADTDTPDRMAGYKRFKIWETENAELVVQLRKGRRL